MTRGSVHNHAWISQAMTSLTAIDFCLCRFKKHKACIKHSSHCALTINRMHSATNAQHCLGMQPTSACVNLLPLQSIIFFIANAMEGSKGQLLTGAT